MLQDYVRTNTYRTAISQLAKYSFQDKSVMDVGAGSGVLSFFAVQNGASKVYAIEASNMANNLQILLSQNEKIGSTYTSSSSIPLSEKIKVIKAKVEDINIEIPKVDTIVSEPIGVLLLHERMLESFIYSRDKYLKQNGTIAPSMGSICLAPITDSYLWAETREKSRFWTQRNFLDIDLSPLAKKAFEEYFSCPVVGCFNPNSIMSTEQSITRHNIDFYTVSLPDIQKITVNIDWDIKYTGIIHAIGGWFDLEFNLPPSRYEEASIPFVPSNNTANSVSDNMCLDNDTSSNSFPYSNPYNESDYSRPSQSPVNNFSSTTPCLPITLSTSPSHAPTHWQQIRLLLREPVAVNYGQKLVGSFTFTVNSKRSYDIKFDFEIVNNPSFPSHDSSKSLTATNTPTSMTSNQSNSHSLNTQYLNYNSKDSANSSNFFPTNPTNTQPAFSSQPVQDSAPSNLYNVIPGSRKSNLWYLHEQVFNYSYHPESSSSLKLESLSLYSPQ
ncbi:hypothetical protein BB560_001629 [Smittium megazygosporum]|uniref:type I protein arginine methyltransferase n=1 Tax=Smittium megazygosporum TaxID=133381 RepID=A0A2T9ZH29_9FUNG|nr:hypothetical protein BB560_001629 [Smittium megazygosporum]